MREVKELDITIPKCDYLTIPFSRKVNNETVPFGENDLLFFSVKKFDSDEDYVFQKTLDDGITYDSSNSRYLVEIFYDDTKDLTIGENLVYDLTVYYNGNRPVQKLVGNFHIGTKITLNEVV